MIVEIFLGLAVICLTACILFQKIDLHELNHRIGYLHELFIDKCLINEYVELKKEVEVLVKMVEDLEKNNKEKSK